MKKINVGQRIQNKDIGQRIKSIEKKTVASTVIYICLLLQKKIGISFIVFNSYFSCQFSYPVGVDRKKKKKQLKIQYFSFGCSFTFPVGDAIIFFFFPHCFPLYHTFLYVHGKHENPNGVTLISALAPDSPYTQRSQLEPNWFSAADFCLDSVFIFIFICFLKVFIV